MIAPTTAGLNSFLMPDSRRRRLISSARSANTCGGGTEGREPGPDATRTTWSTRPVQAMEQAVHSYRHVKALTERLVTDALAALEAGTPTPSGSTLTEFAQYGLATSSEQAALLHGWIEPDLLVLDDLSLARRIADVCVELLQAIDIIATSCAAPSSSPPTGWCRTGANTWATPPWPPPSSTASCIAAPGERVGDPDPSPCFVREAAAFSLRLGDTLCPPFF